MSEPSNQGFTAASQGTLVNNVSGTPEAQRTPTVFKYGNLTTGAMSMTVWTPVAGKKFRLLGYTLDISNDIAEAALDTAVLVRDGGNIIFDHACTIPAVSIATVAGGKSIIVVLNGNGYLSTVINQTITVTVGANLTAGRITMTAWGTEE